MDREALRELLLGTFRAELADHVQSLTRDLVALERDGRADAPRRVASLLATFHTLKGAARTQGATAVADACHEAEDVLIAIRDGRRAVDRAGVDRLLALVDGIEAAGGALAGTALAGTALAGGVRADGALHRRAGAGPGAARTGAPVGSVGPRASDTPARTDARTEPNASTAAARSSVPGVPVPPAPYAAPHAVPDAEGWVRVRASTLEALRAANADLLIARTRAAGLVTLLGQVREQLGRSLTVRAAGRREDAASHAVKVGGDLLSVRALLEQISTQIETDLLGLQRAARGVEERIDAIRLVPFEQLWPTLARQARDLAHEEGKDVEAILDSAGTLVDRAVLERIKDPIAHLISNAIIHGIESPAGRAAAGKPPGGRVRLTVKPAARGIAVEVQDDGCGMDVVALGRRADRMGLEAPTGMPEAIRLAFRAGVSTAPRVTGSAGRGIGLDAVTRGVTDMGGSIECSSEPGSGTRVRLLVPPALTGTRALVVRACGGAYAIRADDVHGAVSVRRARAQLDTAGQSRPGRSVDVDAQPVPLVSLARLLGVGSADRAESVYGGEAPVGTLALILGDGARRVALVVDAVLDEQEVVVQDLGPYLVHTPCLHGAALSPSGEIVLVLDAQDLIARAIGPGDDAADTPSVVASF